MSGLGACRACNGLGGTRWHEADGSENGEQCPKCLGIGEDDSVADPYIRIYHVGGNCPVQGDGTVDGKPFYFRARGEHWRIGIGGEPDMCPEWVYGESYGTAKYAAGWMPQYEAIGFIAKAVGLYANREQPRGSGDELDAD